MDLTEQLGKTVLYGDIALSPDGKHVAWVQSTAATTSKQTYLSAATAGCIARLRSTSETAAIESMPIRRGRPIPKRSRFFSNAGEGEQKQLWIVNADGSGAKKLTKLSGYAARPRWSHDGKQIALLYIEGAGGGGPLMAAPTTTGVIDKAIHNQRIAVLDVGDRPAEAGFAGGSSRLRFRLVAGR